MWVIFYPIAEILGGSQIDPSPQAEWVDLDPPKPNRVKDCKYYAIKRDSISILW